jgi:hypothetical protein
MAPARTLVPWVTHHAHPNYVGFSEIGQHANSTSYLRFLRTKEKAENFQTIKIIGKAAFGEAKLVLRKNDGTILASEIEQQVNST